MDSTNRHPSVSRRSGRIAAILAVALSSAAVAQAGEGTGAEALAGQWAATIVNPASHQPVAVTLRLAAPQPGKPSGDLHFGAPWSCQLETQYAGMAGGSHYFAFIHPNGGYCDNLSDGGISLTAQGGGLAFVIRNDKGQQIEQGTFAQQAGDGTGAEALAGQWAATIVNPAGHQPIAVTLRLAAPQPGQPSGELHFGAPRSCQLETQYAGMADDSHYFAFIRPTGGYCDQLSDGGISLTAQQGGLAFVIRNDQGQPIEQGTFAPPAAGHP